MGDQGDVTWVGLILSLSLVVIAIGVSLRERLGLERDMVVSVVRSAVQLLLVALALQVVVDPKTPLFWSWLWVAGIVVFAAVTVRRRAPQLPGVLEIALVANAVTAAVALGLTFGLGIFPVDGRTVVPVAGMVVGNSMKSCVVVVTALAGLMADRRPEIEARLALGLPGIDAARPLVRRALRLAISPQIENTKALGIVFLPGAMTGPHPRGRRPARRGARPARADVDHPRRRRGDDRDDGDRRDTAALHGRPAAAAAGARA